MVPVAVLCTKMNNSGRNYVKGMNNLRTLGAQNPSNNFCFTEFATLKELRHRRRMELEDKAKVVASVWGEEFVQFLAALAVLPWSI